MAAPAFTFSPRTTRLAALAAQRFDVLVVGGGITGAGCAFDLAARGLSVALIERGDWAQETSSASSRLIHGGLRYLEHGELRLVRESLRERAWLLDAAPGIVQPEPFLFALRDGDRIRPKTMFLGLCAYTLLALPRPLSMPRLVSRAGVGAYVPGIDATRIAGGALYTDARTHDARLTVAVVRSAAQRGAVVATRVELERLERIDDGVVGHVVDRVGGARFDVRAAAAVLAGGPSSERLRARAALEGRWLAPTRGSHIVVARERLPIDASVALLAPLDGRVMFLLRRDRHTVIGTTDLDVNPDAPVRATRDEVRYLLDAANALAPTSALSESDVLSTWAGLRPLLASTRAASARSREERIESDGTIWTIAGGKLTTFRAMAERLGARVCAQLRRGDTSSRSPTRRLALDVDHGPMDGPQALDDVSLTQLMTRDDALFPEDVLWRRTDLGNARADVVRAAIARISATLGTITALDAAAIERAEAEALARLARNDAWRQDA
jgi:glycerol-3-phosphate dehydrogenase